MLRALLLVLTLALGAGSAAAQQAAAPPPPGLSQADFDRLVDAISQSVVERLRKEGAVASPAGGQAPAAEARRPPSSEGPDAAAAGFAEFFSRGGTILLAMPSFFSELARIPGALDRSHEGGRGVFVFLLLLVASGAAAVAAYGIVERGLERFRRSLAKDAGPDGGPLALLRLVGIALIDGVALGAMWLVSNAATGLWFAGTDAQSRFAGFVLASIFSWALYMFAFRLVLRPGLSQARLVAMSDEGAAAVFRNLSIAVIAVLAVRVPLRSLIALHSPTEAISAGQLIGNAIILAAFVWAARRSRDPVAGWFTALARPGSVWAAIGLHWTRVAIPFFIVLVGAQVYGAISAKFSVPAAMLVTLNTAMALILFETLLAAAVVRLGGSATAPAGAGERAEPRVADVIARCLRVAVLIFAVTRVTERWIVDVVHLVDDAGWDSLTRGSAKAGAVLFIAYVMWEVVRFFTDRYVAKSAGHVDEDEHAAGNASRLATMMPLLRIALAIVISIVSLLIVLSELGVNITPLIAGASVFGLAISFGSQTLVRDIVSGIFYLADDAFRIGEYIDCGKAKGTVEGFTLRSIKLRHQNGQVHTIPFGQLGQITNFSRDWTTVKFNLKFARDTDVEKLRKATKKIGQEMLEDPEMKAEIIEPLKMQGVADILENALVARFKFTVKPGKPSFIQRDAVKRMVRTFPGLGIEFASATVAVQTVGGDAASAGAAVQALQARAQAEAAATTTG
ncbi:mechanosensitive ion channel family protein [Alsobacter sp. R-9]